MSVELQTKLDKPILLGECINDTSTILHRLLGGTSVPRIEVHAAGKTDVAEPIVGGARRAYVISIHDEASVDVDVATFEGPAFQDEEGTWIIAEVGPRTHSSFVLALAFIAAAALRTSSPILDDAGHLGLGREIDPNRLIERLRLHMAAASFEDAADLLCKSVGFQFGGD